jgi:pyruvate dehydrogenase E1 component beta subunit
MRKITYREAIREALYEEMERDSSTFLIGEDIGVYGGCCGVTKGLIEKFGSERVKDTPISENAIMGGAVGAAMTGTRPIVEIMLGDFLACCMDEVFNKAAKYRYLYGGLIKMPLTVRSTIGTWPEPVAGIGGEHSQSCESMFMNCPGLKLVTPSTPYDAKGLLKTSIRDDNAVLFFEHKQLYDMEGEVPEDEFLIPLGEADVKRKGDDVTVIALSIMVHKSLRAAEELEKEGISVEVIDLRTPCPIDKKTIIESVEKTGRAVIVYEANKTGGTGSEIGMILAEEAFDVLRAPIRRVATPDIPVPASKYLEQFVIPNEMNIIEAVKETTSYKKR